MNRKVDEILRILKNRPAPKVSQQIPREEANPVTEDTGDKDMSLPRRADTPWREKMTRRAGGGGTMLNCQFYIVYLLYTKL